MAKDINIGGRLHSIATGNVVAGADEILDDNLGKKQTQINTETYSLVESVNNALAELSPDQQEALGVAAKANANEAKLGYYVCDTNAGTAAKTIAATGYVLTTGGNIRIKMTNANTADSATLNINSTGAKALFYNGTQASSTNSWKAGEVIEVYYDGTQYQCQASKGGEDSTTVIEELPITWTPNSYINSSNTVVACNGYSSALNVDVTGYSKIIANVKATNASRVVILDASYNVLVALNGSLLTIDLSNYPTVKYMSFSNKGNEYIGKVYGERQVNVPLQESYAEFVEFGDSKENYIRQIGTELYVAPKTISGFCIYTNNVVGIVGGSTNQYTDYATIPVGATKIYYTGRSYGDVAGVLFYDKYKNMISNVNGGSDTDVTDMEFNIPANAVYVRCSSLNAILSYKFDVMPAVVLETNKVVEYKQIPLQMTLGGYISADNEIVAFNNSYYIKDYDISEYAGKRIVAMTYAGLAAARNLLLDADFNILLSKTGLFDIDLSNYPTAKYISLTNYSSTSTVYSGTVYVIKESDETMSEIVNSYYDVYQGQSPAYSKMISEMFYVEPKADIVGYYISTGGIPVAFSNGHYTSEYYLIPPTATKIYYTGVSYGNAAAVLFYDKYKNQIKATVADSSPTPVTNVEINIEQGAVYYRLSSMSAACTAHFDNPVIPVGGNSNSNDLSNYLAGKKYVAIGDSFTAAIGTEVIETGPLAGFSKVYPYIIGNRNNMTVLNQGSSGTVLNWYIYTGKYAQIPEDVDYITIWYGINDSGHRIPVGTVDDEPESITAEANTSTCGGFNWFFKWLLTNRPLAHIGVIVTDSCDATRREAIIACCQKWGIPYLDLYDPTVPMIRTRGTTQYAHSTSIAPLGYVEVCAEAKTLRNTVFSTDPSHTNIHPNNTCHEWQSTIIENFMRGL